jgi:hypothetical protein
MGRAMIDAALSWSDRGFSVFPLKPRGKEPLGWLAPHGVKDATRDPARIRDWWRREPKANVGLQTGEGHFVLDLDGDGAVAWLVNSGGRHGGAPRTLTVKTSRGWHLYFKSAAEVPCSAGRIAPHVDVRGKGGSVTAPPSIHPSGGVYTIRRDLPIAEAPRWLVDEALPNERHVAPEFGARPAWQSEDFRLRAVPGILSLLANARPGERNSITYWAACRFNEMVRDGLITQHLAEGLLLQGASRCGLNGMEILATARSASRQGARA